MFQWLALIFLRWLSRRSSQELADMAGSKQTWHGTPSGRRWSIDPTAIPSPIALRSLPPSAMETYSMLSSDDRDDHHAEPPLFGTNRNIGASLSSLNDARVQFALTQTPPMGGAGGAGSNVVTSNTQNTLSPVLHCFSKEHRGELDMAEKYNYDLSKAQLKASSRTSALLAGFAMVCLVELQYDDATPHHLLIILGVVTSLLVSVHLLALMMSTCILPYMEATGCTQDSPHLKLKFYIDLSWLFSTCIGLLLFLVEIGVIFYVKFDAVGYPVAGYITTAMLIPVVIVFVVFSYLIHKNRVSHSLGRFKDKVDTMKQFLDVEANLPKPAMSGNIRDI